MTRSQKVRLVRGLAALWLFSALITAGIVRAAVTGKPIL